METVIIAWMALLLIGAFAMGIIVGNAINKK